ncbi:amidase [Mycobacterium saskatchewanense]|nr:amidase family protein [Mycobacterium saskatchewanense]BBX61356.1 amidase [Mycobacterium saskatchewanense]
MKADYPEDAALDAMTATEIAAAVRAGTLDPVVPTQETLCRIGSAGNTFGAFRRVREFEAFAEAAALRTIPNRAKLPLAGVPIAVKDVTAVAGEHPVWGSGKASAPPFQSDSDVTARLRAAGAVIVGLTRVPELCLWPMTDTAGSVVRNPWAPSFTAGGSSGGSAAAVAAGFVPIAHGTDAFGSVRSPAAICGLVGITPGIGTVPASDSWQWSGLYTHGPLATTVADAALLLSVLARHPDLANIRQPAPLRIAVSTKLPTGVGPVPKAFTAAATRTAQLLASTGHRVDEAHPRYGTLAGALFTRWLAGPGETDPELDWRHIEVRTARHLAAAATVRRLGLVRNGGRRKWVARALEFFGTYDVLVTPMLATMPPQAICWRTRGWLANAIPSVRLTDYLGPWDLAGFPAMSIPAGRHESGLPVGVQIVAPPGGESRLLTVAAQLEELAPWPRTARQPSS